MDIYGIGTAMKALVNVYMISGRGSGRTAALIERLKDGDRVGFMNQREAERVKRLCLEQGKKIEIIVFKSNPLRSFGNISHGKPGTRLLFNHDVIETLYQDSINDTQAMIEHFYKEHNQPPYVVEPMESIWRQY
jgi:hypothetical protein